MSGRIIITGASGGMGSAATRALTAKGIPVVMACRNLSKARKVREDILREQPSANLEIRELHLDSFKSVRAFADSFGDEKVAGLFNNAGTMPRRFSLSEDGYELTLAVNYLGPWLLTHLLIPHMEEDASIVNMVSISSYSAHISKSFPHEGAKGFHQLSAYSESKLALTYFTIMLASRCTQRVNAADPGIVDTDIIRLDRWFDPLTDLTFRPFCKSPEQGAAPAVSALLSTERGKLFSGHGFKDFPDKFTRDSAAMQRIWDRTEEELKDWL